MGVDLKDLFEKEEISLDFLNERKVGVDSFNVLYQFLSTIRGPDGSPLMDSNGKITSHLTGLLYRTTNLMQKGIKPVFVFDGKHHILKSETVEARHKIRTEAKEKFEQAKEAGDFETARKFGQQSSSLSKEMVEDSKKLVELMGLPVVQAPAEGEAQVSFMVEKGDLYGAVSQDYDCLMFGAPLLFRNITVTGKRKIPGKEIYIDVVPEKIELEKNLKLLGISRKKLVWLGILIGTDFNKKFPKIGPKTAIDLVKEFDSFEEIIKHTKFEPEFDYHEIEDIFLNKDVTKDYEIKFNPPQVDKIVEFLCKEHDFSEDRVRNALGKISEKSQEKGTQSRLSSWQ